MLDLSSFDFEAHEAVSHELPVERVQVGRRGVAFRLRFGARGASLGDHLVGLLLHEVSGFAAWSSAVFEEISPLLGVWGSPSERGHTRVAYRQRENDYGGRSAVISPSTSMCR